MDDSAAAAPAPSPSEWLAFAFIRDAPRMPGGQYLGIETAPVEPWPHQRVVARRLVDGWPLSWMLCDEVGLGKTIEAGLALRALRMCGYVERALIAVPASIAAQWQREMADKCLLPFARALGGARPRHRLLLPREHERAAASLFDPDLLIVSTGLMTRRERQPELKGADGWNLVLLDEAHCARRSNPTTAPDRPARWTRLYRIARDVLRPKADALWLATATPMQLEPIEAIDLATLARRLGPFALEPRVALAYYGLLAKLRAGAEPEPLEWRFLARAARNVLRFDVAAGGFVERAAIRGRAGAALRRWLDASEAASAAPAPSLRKAALRLLFAVAPLSRAMMRHDRGLLRRYHRQGRLAAPLPTRKVHLPAIRLTDAEREVYELFAPYCRTLAEQVRAHSRQRIAVGFMLSFFGLRFASSYKAIHDTLARRRDKVVAALEGRPPLSPGEAARWTEHDWDEREREDHDWEGRAHDEADTPDDDLLTAGLRWRSRIDLAWEVEQLTALLGRLAPLAQLRSPKVRALLKALRARRGADGRLRQAVVFTRFYDTLVDLQGWIERDEPSARLGVFSGPRCAWMDETGTWHPASREEVKRRFVRVDIDLLLCTDAAAEGLNLQSADLLVNVDLPWNPMKLEQRIGRIDRIGQRHRTIHVINLAYPGTVEEEVYVRLLRRIQGAAGTVGTQPLVVLPIDPADLRRLSIGELTPERLEAMVRERLRLARERAESMSPTAAELHALYRELGDEMAATRLPITLAQVFETLAGSATLKALGSERIESPHGAALLVRGVPGCVEEFGQLATLQPGRWRAPVAAALAQATQRAAERAEAVSRLRQVGQDASLAAATHHRLHRALAAKLVAARRKEAGWASWRRIFPIARARCAFRSWTRRWSPPRRDTACSRRSATRSTCRPSTSAAWWPRSSVSGWGSGARAAAPAKTKSRSRSWPSDCREPRADRHDARGGEMPVRNLAVAAVFEEIADRLAIQGANVFRINAYRNAARMLQELCGDVAAMAEQGRDLTELRGIDADSAGKICEIAKTGGCELLERLRREMPSAVTVLLRIPGLGPKRVAALWHDLDLLLTARKAREHGVHLELNAHPERLDVIDTHCRMAKDEGVLIAITSDAHDTAQLRNLRFGVGQARRGWIERGDVLNARSLRELLPMLDRARAADAARRRRTDPP